LFAGAFFFISSISHIVEHFFPLTLELNLISEYSLLIGLFLLALGIYRYWSLQKKYTKIRREISSKG
jgi:hypothetical protein